MRPRPRLAARFLEWWLPAEDRDEIIGDLDEQFARRAGRHGRGAARPWYLAQVFDLARRYGRHHRLSGGPGSGGRRVMPIDEVRNALRQLRARPAAAAITAGMLAAAIGLSTGAFAVLDSLVLERAPFHDPDRLRTVRISFNYGSDNPELINLIKGWRAAGTFEAVEAAGVVPSPAETPASNGTTALVTPGMFDMLGVRPVRGRAFTDDDARAGGVEPVVISERLWRQAFHGDSARLGELVSLNGEEYVLIGVMPADFRFPSWDTMAWRPLSLDATPFPDAAGRSAYVRLPADVPEADVMERATRIAGLADARFTARPNELFASPIGGGIDRYAGRAIPLFTGAVGLIFLSLCANAGGLLLARMTARRRELGIRLSLGASRWRLVRECALEHALTGAFGVAAGIAVAAGLTAVAPRALGEGFNLTQSLNPINVDARALAIAASLGFVAVLVGGLLPAWIGLRVDPALSIKPSERTHTESRSARAMTRSLVVAQIAFGAMLLVGAALLARSFERMTTVDRGMDARGVYTMNGFMSSVAPAVLDDLEARVAAIPGVEDVAVADAAPPDANATALARWYSDASDGLEFPMRLYDVRPDFFDFYGLTLLQGRLFDSSDGANVAIVGERVAALLWPNRDPLGKTMRTEDGSLHLQVVGVAKEITLPSLADGVDLPEIYVPHSGRRRVVTVGWRCSSLCPDQQQVAAAFRDADPGAEPLHMNSTEQRYARELVRPRAAARLGATFAGIGFATSGAGLFALLSHAVGRRRREFGIRTALGATPAVLRRTVSREALSIAAIGIAIGGLGAWALGRALASVMYGVSTRDPIAWAAMIAIVTLTTLVASWRPSRQAARVDPVQLLREE
jgi:predicted permease